MKKFLLFLLFPIYLFSLDIVELQKTISAIPPRPFKYDLSPTLLQGKSRDAPVLLCLHGYGGNASIGQVLHSYNLPHHIISFNFPDHSLYERAIPNKKTTFGTIQELLPFLYIVKTLIIDSKLNTINLYGFSAGGAALINGIAVLNGNLYKLELESIGIFSSERQQILQAIQKGTIILDAPLKSMRELMRKRKESGSLRDIAKRYETNKLEPIDSLMMLSPLALDVIVYFEVPDEAVLNDDDDLYEQRLREYNRKGKTTFIRGSSGGHLEYHKELWERVIPRAV